MKRLVYWNRTNTNQHMVGLCKSARFGAALREFTVIWRWIARSNAKWLSALGPALDVQSGVGLVQFGVGLVQFGVGLVQSGVGLGVGFWPRRWIGNPMPFCGVEEPPGMYVCAYVRMNVCMHVFR